MSVSLWVVKGLNRGACQGRIQDFKLGGGALKKKLRRAEGGAKLFGVFRVKNHDFTQTNHIFFNLWGGGGVGAGCATLASAPGSTFALQSTEL